MVLKFRSLCSDFVIRVLYHIDPYIPFRPKLSTLCNHRFLRSSGTFSAGPNQSVRTRNPANHKMPHRSWAFTLPGSARTSHGAVPLVMMMRAVLPRKSRCQKIERLPDFVLM